MVSAHHLIWRQDGFWCSLNTNVLWFWCRHFFVLAFFWLWQFFLVMAIFLFACHDSDIKRILVSDALELLVSWLNNEHQPKSSFGYHWLLEAFGVDCYKYQ